MPHREYVWSSLKLFKISEIYCREDIIYLLRNHFGEVVKKKQRCTLQNTTFIIMMPLHFTLIITLTYITTVAKRFVITNYNIGFTPQFMILTFSSCRNRTESL